MFSVLLFNSITAFSQNCEVPKPTTWKNYYQEGDNRLIEKDEYRIQFLCVKHTNKINIPIEYIEVKEDCFRRFYVYKVFYSLQEALDYLPTVQLYYPDAFPIKKQLK